MDETTVDVDKALPLPSVAPTEEDVDFGDLREYWTNEMCDSMGIYLGKKSKLTVPQTVLNGIKWCWLAVAKKVFGEKKPLQEELLSNDFYLHKKLGMRVHLDAEIKRLKVSKSQ